MKKFRGQKGFTLIELLVVIAIIAILAVIVFVALNPVKRFRDSRNARRQSDVGEMLTAVHACIVDNGGALAPCIGTPVAGTTYEIVSGAIAAGCDATCTTVAATDCLRLDTTLAAYLKSIPRDPGPQAPLTPLAAGHTGYSFNIDANNLVTIDACAAEGGATISASR